MPFLDFLLDKNPIYRLGPPSLGNIQRVALERIAARVQGKDRDYNPAVPDYLHHFLEARKENPVLVDDGMLLGYLFINLVAGADTTALSIRAVIYFLLKNPKAYERVKKEIRGAKLGRVAKYHEAKALPCESPARNSQPREVFDCTDMSSDLEAVIRETMRLHPGVSMLLERYVPAGGLKLPDGSLVPPQTSVGLNAYVTHRNKDIYSPDADEYKPERWLRAAGESEEAYQQRLKVYLKYDFTFGAGPRICLGRHVAVIKTYKLVATLISNYDIELDHPDREWKIHCGWFLRQYGIICNLKKVQ
jgi:cytochrome P450